MRPSPGKEEGLVLDNAGLWLEHGFCQQDRIWTLKGKKKRKRRESLELVFVVMDQDGIIREAHIPQQVEGMELIELTQEAEDLLVFESFLSFALNKGHKPYSAYLRFEEQYLSENNQNLNLIHLKYIQNRISRLPGAPNQGTWYHIKKKVITIGSSEGLDRMFIIKKVKVSGAEYCGF
ncbi:hypothetical protein [Parabacteroides goldsteinii]|uniref:hypothetical protein n=1 Tax=Parabacteroides goldsteinii TaxID=328812 RepID=UPI0039923951